MARIPRDTCKIGNKRCEGCGKRRLLYVPATREESLALGAFAHGDGLTEALCGECLTARRKSFVKREVAKVIAKHTAPRHAFEGSAVVSRGSGVEVVPPDAPPRGRVGVSAFVWVHTSSGKHVTSAGCLDLQGSVYADLKAIPGVSFANINLD